MYFANLLFADLYLFFFLWRIRFLSKWLMSLLKSVVRQKREKINKFKIDKFRFQT